MGGAGDDVGLAVAVNIVGEHVGTDRTQIDAMELPGGDAIDFFRLFPPAVGNDNVNPAIAIDVAMTQAVREIARAGNFLPLLTRFTDRQSLPRLIGVLARDEIAHLALIVLAWRLPAHDEDFF